MEFLVGSAESLPVENQTVSLLLCAQSFHWLDQEKFYKEVDRVLMPGGCLAVFAHHFNEFEQPSLNRIAHEVFRCIIFEHFLFSVENCMHSYNVDI